MLRTCSRSIALVAIAFVAWTADPAAQAAATRQAPVASRAAVVATRPITHDAYDSWKSIQGVTLSRDGAWLAYTLAPQDGDGELVVRNLATGKESRHPRGKDATFTSDSRFVVFGIAALDAELDKAKKAKKKPEDMPKGGVGVVELATQATFTADRIKSFKVPKDAGARARVPEGCGAEEQGRPRARTEGSRREGRRRGAGEEGRRSQEDRARHRARGARPGGRHRDVGRRRQRLRVE